LKIRFFLIALTITILRADFDSTITNTNFILSQGSGITKEDKNFHYDYNRLRLRSDYTAGDYFTTLIADHVNYIGQKYTNSASFTQIKKITSDTPFETATSYSNYGEGTSYAKLYRLYTGFEDAKQRIVVGLQNISMGVGRIWVPNNLFNPKNSFTLEPDEVFGVVAMNYTRHLSETAEVNLVASQRRDDSFKYLARFKALLETTEIAFNIIHSDSTQMLGLEFEGDLLETGVELRAEAVYLESLLKKSSVLETENYFTQAILGADYGFKNGVTFILEGFYSSQTFSYSEMLLNLNSDIPSSLVYSHAYLGTSLSYAFNLYLDGGISYIESFNDQNSRFIAPHLKYTLNDYNTLSLGAMILDGGSSSEFGQLGSSYYLKYTLSF
jgi:hypothetical protein